MPPRSKPLAIATLLAAALALVSCGGGSTESRPVEILYFVQGPTGAKFRVVAENDPRSDCMAISRDQSTGLIPSGGYGFQSSDATHVPANATFVAPHYFVFENERQPTRAVLRNLADTPLTVQQLRGLAPPATTLETQILAPGECRSVSTFDDRDEIAGVAGPDDFDRDFRIEVCSFARGTELPSGFRCQDLRDDDAADTVPSDIGAAFFSTVGDLNSSYLSRCLQLEGSEQLECRTPATFYMFDPADILGVAMTRLSGQLDSFLQVDLYRGDQLLDSNRGTGDVFVRHEL
jgi:hypothetical protein